ncbi:DEAD/DEAH box helicase [Paenibacillus marinisediminis]
MITTKPIVPRCKMLDNGSVFLWKELEHGYNPVAFKHLLFGWHAPSCYGTMLEIHEQRGVEGFIVPPLMAMHYFCQVSPIEAAVIHWSDEAQLLMRIASLLREALKHGWYTPDIDKWNEGSFGWKLKLPESLVGTAASLWQEAKRLELGPVHIWLDAIIAELIEQHEPLESAWSNLRSEQPMLPDQADLMGIDRRAPWQRDEEDWLVSLGIKEDPLPFRTGLRLLEPYGDEHSWSLELVLQDKEKPERLLRLGHDSWDNSNTVTTDNSVSEEHRIPAHWEPYIKERVDKSLSLWALQLPELTDSEYPERLRNKLTNDEAWKFLSEYSARLLAEGTAVFLPSWWESLKRSKLRMKAKMKSSAGSAGSSMLGIQQLLDFDWKFAVGDMTLTEDELEQLARQQQRLVRFRDRWIELDPATLARIRAVMNRVRKKRGLSFRDVLEMVLQDDMNNWDEDSLLERDDEDYLKFEIELNEALTDMIAKLQQKQSMPLIHAPESFLGSLRKYQTEGLSWLLFLRQFGLGGCLADDMGLGKTIQFINYLLVLRGQNQLLSPAILICPTSVLGNWQKELERFAPSLRVYIHYGSNRKRGPAFVQVVEDVDLVLTSYTTAQMDEDDLAQITWSCVCLDEAQYVKNVYTKQSAAVRRLEAQHRIALTGTPIENRLTELWSIFDFINPGYLGSLNEFRHRYILPIERDRNAEVIQQVQKLINPFLLRRVKKDPAIQLDLPDKNEMKVYVPLTVEQGTLYEGIIQDMLDKIDRLTAMERRGLILATLTKLKQVCDLPDLLLKGQMDEPWVSRSNKVERLLDMVEELRAEGDRCLIFTQFVGMGEWLQRTISQHTGEQVLFLHGGVPKKKRDEMIANFQNTDAADAPAIFILSLKAGGTGLNLTAANHVFHFDRWWNPAVENQATDRAFRIGQTRDVQVHKFITLGTLEERIDEMLELKQGLSDSIVTGGENWITEMSTEQLRELFTLRRSWEQED